jgi:DNA-binding NarL/FixJ family response regulator
MPATKGLRILVADDEEFTQVMLQELLTAAGYEVRSVGSVKDALEVVEKFEPHVVLSDLNFGPGPSGAELLTRIARDAPWIGLVILTSHASPELAVSSAGDIPAHTIYLIKSELDSIDTLVKSIQASLDNSDPAVFRERTNKDLIQISSAQAEVLRLIAEGLSNAAIADFRKTSLRATEGLIQRTFSALGISSESDLNPRIMAAKIWQQGKAVVK